MRASLISLICCVLSKWLPSWLRLLPRLLPLWGGSFEKGICCVCVVMGIGIGEEVWWNCLLDHGCEEVDEEDWGAGDMAKETRSGNSRDFFFVRREWWGVLGESLFVVEWGDWGLDLRWGDWVLFRFCDWDWFLLWLGWFAFEAELPMVATALKEVGLVMVVVEVEGASPLLLSATANLRNSHEGHMSVPSVGEWSGKKPLF